LPERERDAAAWIAAREAGRTVAAIAAETVVASATVSRATSLLGPFVSPTIDDETAEA
jgi:DNA-binding MurR/RpiR family transcriptional regulator